MATQETQLQLLIGQGDSDSDIGRPARARPVHLRLVEEPPTRWARLRARGLARHPRRGRMAAPEYPSTDVWRALATGRWR
jgi:hypothetical protein